MALLEIAAVVGNHHLVDLLVVLAGVIGVRGLRGQGVERHALQMVGELHVARDFGHLLQRVHHLHGRAKLRTLRRGGAVQRLVAPVQPRRQADVAAYVLEAFLHGRHMRRVVAALVVDHRLLDPLREVHAVQREGRRDHLPAGEDARPVERLPVDQVAQLQQEFVARDVVKPVDDAQIVAAALFAPESPVPQRGLRKLAQLVTEIGAHQFDDALVARRRVVLLQHLEHDHLGPPVAGVVALYGRAFERTVFRRAEIAVGLPAAERPLDPGAGLFDQPFVAEDIGQRQQPVDPVGAAFPDVAVAAQPAVARAHHLGVDRIEVPRQPVGLTLQLVAEPPFGADGAQRKFHEGLFAQRGAVVGIGCRGRRGGRYQEQACQQQGHEFFHTYGFG